MITASLLACALVAAQPPDRAEWLLAPSLPPGLELVYTGSCSDESLAPHVSFQRQYRLELHVLALPSSGKNTNLAMLTALSLRERKETKGTKADPGWSVRL